MLSLYWSIYDCHRQKFEDMSSCDGKKMMKISNPQLKSTRSSKYVALKLRYNVNCNSIVYMLYCAVAIYVTSWVGGFCITKVVGGLEGF